MKIVISNVRKIGSSVVIKCVLGVLCIFYRFLAVCVLTLPVCRWARKSKYETHCKYLMLCVSFLGMCGPDREFRQVTCCTPMIVKRPTACLNKDLETCTADEAMTRIGLLRQEESCLVTRYAFTRAYLSLKRTGVSEILLFIWAWHVFYWLHSRCSTYEVATLIFWRFPENRLHPVWNSDRLLCECK
jgi:hypothetical protein